MIKVKVKFTLEQATKAQRVSRGISTLSLTSVLDGVGGQRLAPAALPPGKTRYPLHRRLGGLHGCYGQLRNISPPTGIRSSDRPSRSESLYLLRTIIIIIMNININSQNFLKRKLLLIKQCLRSGHRHFLLPVVKLSLGLNRAPVWHSRGERGTAAAHGPFCETSRSVYIWKRRGSDALCVDSGVLLGPINQLRVLHTVGLMRTRLWAKILTY